MDQIKHAYRQFLNTSAAKFVEPNTILSPLVKAKILSLEEAELVKNEPTKAKRQYQLFIKILPTKGKKVSKQVDKFIQGVRVLDKHAVYDAYKHTDNVKDFIKSLKQMSSVEKKKKSTPSQDSEERDHSEPQTPDTASVHSMQSFDGFDDIDTPFNSIGNIERPLATSTRRATEPAFDHLSVKDLPQSRSISTEEKLQTAAIDPGDVELGSQIGSGGFATVYLGRYKNKRVAVKMFRDYDDFTLTMFFDEVNIMKSLSHPNILEFVGFYNEGTKRRLWLLTDFIDGGSMRRFCRKHIDKLGHNLGLSLEQKLIISRDCWRGLDYLHRHNVCHKDISPDNVLISEDLSIVKISDFGLAEIKQLMGTVVTQISGTPMYFPPEYAAENGILRHPVKSDVYSMGASLCELFSETWFWNDGGELPKNHFQVLYLLSEQRRSVETKDPPKDPSCWNLIPLSVQNILIHAINPDYHMRMSSAELCDMTNSLLNKGVGDEEQDFTISF